MRLAAHLQQHPHEIHDRPEPGRRVAPRRHARALGIRQLYPAADGGEQGFALPAFGETAAEAAASSKVFHRGRRVRGDLDQRFVLQDAAPRQIATLRFLFPPGRDLAQDRKEPRLVAAQLEPTPGLARRDAVGGGVGQHRHFLLHPVGAPALLDAAPELLISRAEMGHVAQRILQLSLGQGAVRPVREARGFVDASAGQFAGQRLVADRVAEAADHRRDLGIDDRGRDVAGLMKEDLDVLPRGVEYLEDIRIDHQRVERREVHAGRHGVDHRRLFGTRHLHEAENRPEGPIAHELGIDRDERGASLPGHECRKCGGIGNERHGGPAIHGFGGGRKQPARDSGERG